MNDHTIEPDNAKTELPDIFRKSFRVPLENTNKVWVSINDRRYTVLDICTGGVRITIDNQLELNYDQAFNDCEYSLFDVTIKGLACRVVHVHISPDDPGGWQCGLQWTDMSKQDEDRIDQIVSSMKDRLFENNNTVPDSL